MPRPIPDDVENVDGFVWYLIPIPDDPVFVQAAWDAFSELTYPWNWGKEGRVPESDIAAQLWSDAIYEALRVRDMGFPDNILEAVDEVEGLLRDILLASCCANTSVTGDTVTSDIEPDVGDPPDTWGDGELVTDWAEWRQLVCGATDTWITHLIGQVSTIETYLDLGLFTIGVAVAVLSAGAGAGILISIAYGTAVEMFSAILANVNDLVFLDIEDGLQARRAEIRCAIFHGCDELKAEIQSAVGPIAWAAWYQFYDWCSIRNSLLEGTFEGGFHAVNPSTLCDNCPDFTFDFEYTQTFESEYGAWTGGNLNRNNSSCADWSVGLGGLNLELRARDAATEAGYAYNTPAEFYLERIEIDACLLETGLRISLNYKDIADENHDYPSGPKTIELTPPNADEPVSNNTSEAKDIVISQTEAGGGARFTEIRTYWTVVET